jgi:hypothetical protein
MLLRFLPKGGQPERQIALVYTDDGKPMLTFNDTNGKTRVGIMLADPSGKPALSLQDENAKSFFSQVQP